jgi:hypothetical protein
MKFLKLRWRIAALAAFLMGVPLVAEARADDTGVIIGSALGLAGAIIDVAGDS